MASNYPGRNSPKDVRERVATVEQTTIPGIKGDLDSVRTALENELDIPDPVLLFTAALT